MAVWWNGEYFVFHLTCNKDERCESDKQMVRNQIRNLVSLSSKHVINRDDLATVEHAFKCGATHAIMKGGETSAN